MVSEIRTAGTLAGNHTGSLGILRCANIAEQPALRRSHDTPKHFAAFTTWVLLDSNFRHGKPGTRIESFPFGTKAEPAFRNRSNPAPGGINRFEDFIDKLPGSNVPFPCYRPTILIDYGSLAVFNQVPPPWKCPGEYPEAQNL